MQIYISAWDSRPLKQYGLLFWVTCVYTHSSPHIYLIYAYKCYIMSHLHTPTREPPPLLSNVTPNLTSSSISRKYTSYLRSFHPHTRCLKRYTPHKESQKKPIKCMHFGSGSVPHQEWSPQFWPTKYPRLPLPRHQINHPSCYGIHNPQSSLLT